jgi:hypothetical protein
MSASRPNSGQDEGIAIDAAVRERLGLGARETLRVLETGPRLVLLERVDPDAAPVPGEGPPALSAEASIFRLDELLGWVEAAGKSGFLHFQYRDHVKSIWFHRGEVVFASSNQMVDRLGECLLRAGVLSLDQLREAQRCFRPPARFGKVLVERGFLTPRELWNGVKYQVEEIVRSLLAYTAGRVHLWEGETPPDNVVRLSLPTRRLIAEGIQRREELGKFLGVLEDPEVTLACVEGVEAHLGAPERSLAEAVLRQPSFPALCEGLGIERAAAARSIQLLRLVGAVKIVRRPQGSAFVGGGDLEGHDHEPLRESVTRLVKLVAELAGPIARVENGPEGIQDRLQRTLDEVAARFPALLSGVALSRSAVLDAEVLIERALRLPGDREGQVEAALGELVAYLEFELKNHPAIDDPDSLLERLTALRTR